MTLSKFKKIKLEKQLRLVDEKGKLINGVSDQKHLFRLFSLGKFYVELVHDRKDRSLVDFYPVKKSKHLQKYVERFADIYTEVYEEGKRK